MEQFIAVAEERHFTRAAHRCNIAQSALSASIRELERDLGGPLFVRTTRRVELTEAGEALLPAARRVMEAAATARDAVDQTLGRVRGVLSIGRAWGNISQVLAKFREAYPDVEIVLRQGHSTSLIEEVVNGELDIGFVIALPGRNFPSDVNVVSQRSVPVGIICAESHPLAHRKRLEAKSLAG